MSLTSNLDPKLLDDINSTAKEIFEWVSTKSDPEKYVGVDPQQVMDFVHTLDLLETELVNFRIATYLAKMALDNVEDMIKRQLQGETQPDSLGWEIVQPDIESFFASSVLELCYKLSNAWEELEKVSKNDPRLLIFNKHHRKPNDIILARHKVTHFKPRQFEELPLALKYSILRRPYTVESGTLVKERAALTGPKLSKFIQDAVSEGSNYLHTFHEAMVK